jgi:8-oxo-dGTP pyrophosphatase MutT (NUDIX family)
VGPTDEQAAQRDALGAEWRGYWVAGIRESFEEAGLLLAYQEDGALLDYGDANTEARFDAYRGPLHAGEISLREICERENVKLAIDRIHFHNRFVTPLGRPRRFDTRFFIAEAPPGQTGQHDDKETVDSVWISPQEALARSDAEEFGLMGVTRQQLAGLAVHDSKASVLKAAAAQQAFSVTRPKLPPD